jgi:hypothetical protein
MLDVEDRLARIRAAWMAGRAAVDEAPPEWHAATGQGAGAEAALAALAGQAMQVLLRPVPPPLTPRPLLPALSVPSAPEAVRPRIRRLLAARRSDTGGARALVLFLAARGFAMHPADWLPRPTDDWAPAVYAPWQAWGGSEPQAEATDVLSAETYDTWPWAARRAALAAMRRSDRPAARAIIAARAAGEPAERRLRLLEILEDGLSADDAPLLETFAGDRSDRVQALVRRLLARLGRGSAAALAPELSRELAQELAAMVDLGRIGLLKRRNQLTFKPLKTAPQEHRRRELLAAVTLAELAEALGVAEAGLVESLPVDQARIIGAFATMVVETASNEAWRALFDLTLQDAEAPLELAIILSRRADAGARSAMLAAVLARETAVSFDGSLTVAGDRLGAADGGPLARSAAYRALLDLAATSTSQAAGAPPPALATGLTNLGLLLDPAAARTVVDAFQAAGLSGADPRLDMLRLNIALARERVT